MTRRTERAPTRAWRDWLQLRGRSRAAWSAIAGLLLLGQHLRAVELLAIVLVSLASAGAMTTRQRR